MLGKDLDAHCKDTTGTTLSRKHVHLTKTRYAPFCSYHMYSIYHYH